MIHHQAYTIIHIIIHTLHNILTHHSSISIHLSRNYHNIAICVNFLTPQTAPQFESWNSSYNNLSHEQQLCVVIFSKLPEKLARWSSQGQALHTSSLGEVFLICSTKNAIFALQNLQTPPIQSPISPNNQKIILHVIISLWHVNSYNNTIYPFNFIDSGLCSYFQQLQQWHTIIHT